MASRCCLLPPLRPPRPEKPQESYARPQGVQADHSCEYPDMQLFSPRTNAAFALLEVSSRPVADPRWQYRQQSGLWQQRPYHRPHADAQEICPQCANYCHRYISSLCQGTVNAAYNEHIQLSRTRNLPPLPQVVEPEVAAMSLGLSRPACAWRDDHSTWHIFKYYDDHHHYRHLTGPPFWERQNREWQEGQRPAEAPGYTTGFSVGAPTLPAVYSIHPWKPSILEPSNCLEAYEQQQQTPPVSLPSLQGSSSLPYRRTCASACDTLPYRTRDRALLFAPVFPPPPFEAQAGRR